MKVFREDLYKVEKGDTLWSIAKKYKISERQLEIENSTKKIEVGDYIILPQSYSKIYVVKPNDTLESICEKFNTNIEHLRKLNNISNYVFIGQQIFI